MQNFTYRQKNLWRVYTKPWKLTFSDLTSWTCGSLSFNSWSLSSSNSLIDSLMSCALLKSWLLMLSSNSSFSWLILTLIPAIYKYHIKILLESFKKILFLFKIPVIWRNSCLPSELIWSCCIQFTLYVEAKKKM